MEKVVIARRSNCNCCHEHPNGKLDQDALKRFDAEQARYQIIPGMFARPCMWSFLEEMIAKSDDKTVVVINITHEISYETVFLELFQPFGEIISAKLAPLNVKGTRRGGCGFVTFLTKESAQQAIDQLNNGAPRGYDQQILRVDWPPTPTTKSST